MAWRSGRPAVRLGLALAALALACAAVGPAAAQERQRRTLLDIIFGAPKRAAVYEQNGSVYEVEPAPQPERRVTRPPRKKTAPPAAAPVAVEKSADARVVLVVGDFIAGGLAEGLTSAFEKTADIKVVARANGSSGIVRKDYYDWQANLADHIAAENPSVVVISLGANDRQQMRGGESRDKPMSDAWMAEYRRRVDALIGLAHSGDRPVIWAGLPPFQSRAMTADMVTLNGVFRTEMEQAGGSFVDIWDGFVDESGAFVSTGSDVNGQQVRLRAADGINLTTAGKRKLAFYVEGKIRDLLGVADGTGGGEAAKRAGDAVAAAPLPNEPVLRTPPIDIADPELDGGTALLGGTPLPVSAQKTPRDMLVERGDAGEPPPGRIDDFRLAKPSSVISNPVIRN
ncbi:SGNH/GDSL hydrolase family protein [Ensifer soli]|uniref:SGNH/GDSL hydrolase family protein n=1 Tax=Ciceribacter sp. sgz301302 TaxID=3342379 RepID=UPI0035B7F312